MEVWRLRTMGLEIFKSLNNLNTSFIKELFNKKNNVNRRKNDLIIHTQNTVTFGSNGLRCLGPHIWNTLTGNIKEITSFENLKNLLTIAMDLVVNAVFVITKTKYLIKFISICLIQYPCIIFDTVTCTPACYDCSDIIS